MELSVYRTENSTSDELWEICEKYVDSPGDLRCAKARGTCQARILMDLNLTFEADGKPHYRHANVIGWPAVAKHELKSMQQKIAPAMTLELRPKQ
jgi:hypothetical protein